VHLAEDREGRNRLRIPSGIRTRAGHREDRLPMFDELIDDVVSTRDHAPGLPGLGIESASGTTTP
jgi:hypothetical protein